MDSNQQYNDYSANENWDDSESSEDVDYTECEQRNEFMFENQARYIG